MGWFLTKIPISYIWQLSYMNCEHLYSVLSVYKSIYMYVTHIYKSNFITHLFQSLCDSYLQV